MSEDTERAKQEREFQEGLDNIGNALVEPASAANVQADVGHVRLEPDWQMERLPAADLP